MRFRRAVSLPERLVRALFAAAGGLVHEGAELVLPRVVRRSRFYEATAKNLLRVAVELVGGVERTRLELILLDPSPMTGGRMPSMSPNVNELDGLS